MSLGHWLHKHWWLLPVAAAAQFVPGVIPAEMAAGHALGGLAGFGGGAGATGATGGAAGAAGATSGAAAAGGAATGLSDLTALYGGIPGAGFAASHPALYGAGRFAFGAGPQWLQSLRQGRPMAAPQMPQGQQRDPQTEALLAALNAYWAGGGAPQRSTGGFGGQPWG